MKKAIVSKLIKFVLLLNRLLFGIRGRVFSWLKQHPTFIELRGRRKLERFQAIVEEFEQANIDYCIVGGFAFDALRGQLTRVHKDIDIAFPARERESIRQILLKHGLTMEFVTPYNEIAYDRTLLVDLLEWKENEEHSLQHRMHGKLIRIPPSVMTNQTKTLLGFSLRIGSNEFLASALPLVKDPNDRRLIAGLSTIAPLNFKRATREVLEPIEVDCYEFDDV